MLTSDDRLWIRTLVELAVDEIVDALKGDGEVAAQHFRIAYRRLQETGMTEKP